MIRLIQYDEQLPSLPPYTTDKTWRVTPVTAKAGLHPRMSSIIGLFLDQVGNAEQYYINLAHPDAAEIDPNKLPEHLYQIFTTFYAPVGTRIVEPLSRVLAELRTYAETHPRLDNEFYQTWVYPAFETLSDTLLTYLDMNPVYPTYDLAADKARPTGKLGKIDLMSLGKQDGLRETIYMPGYTMVEYDLKQYHIQLLAEEINWTPPADYYQFIGDRYAPPMPGPEKRNWAKRTVLRVLYGEDFPTYLPHSIDFEPLEVFRFKMQGKHRMAGHFVSPLSGKIIGKSEFSYGDISLYLQTIETERNAQLLRQWQHQSGTTAPIILYVYDSFLLRVPDRLVTQVRDEFETLLRAQRLTYSCKQGKTYADLITA